MTDTSRMGKMFGLSSFWESRASANNDTKYAMAQGVPIASFSLYPNGTATPSISKGGEKIVKRKRDVDVKLEEPAAAAAEKQSRSSPPNAKRKKQEIKVLIPSYQQQQQLQKSPINSKPTIAAEKVVMPPEPTSDEVSTTKMATSRIDSLRGIIDTHLSLEILMKHDEVRLINQELAKCQIALEQLRRCHLIPYPTTKPSPFDPIDVSNGTGPAVEPEKGVLKAQWAPPYGVVDGPYTKHYAKWLIPDPKFDGLTPDWTFGLSEEAVPSGKQQVPEGRTTRNSLAEATTPGKTRTQRGSQPTQKLQELSSGYPPKKDKGGPVFHKKADGQVVKLLCLDCNREVFSSVQGFLNHCRIQHHREFKSHEQAAVACGIPAKLNEVGGIVGVVQQMVQTPTFATGLVHPLIRSTPTDKETYLNLMSHIGASVKKFQQGELPGVKEIPSSNFASSSETPFLSNLLKNKGSNINLNELVTEVKAKIVVEESSDEEEEEEEENAEAKVEAKAEKAPPFQHIGGMDGACDYPPIMRVPARSTASSKSSAPFGRPVSSKGFERQTGISPRLSYATPINTIAANHNRHAFSVVDSSSHNDDIFNRDGDTSANSSEGPSFIDLSPNTVASNNDLPALVSDDDEYDEDNDDDGKSLASEDDESDGSDVAEISIEDGEGAEATVVPRAGLKEKKHVAFVSPVKEKKERRGRK